MAVGMYQLLAAGERFSLLNMGTGANPYGFSNVAASVKTVVLAFFEVGTYSHLDGTSTNDWLTNLAAIASLANTQVVAVAYKYNGTVNTSLITRTFPYPFLIDNDWNGTSSYAKLYAAGIGAGVDVVFSYLLYQKNGNATFRVTDKFKNELATTNGDTLSIGPTLALNQSFVTDRVSQHNATTPSLTSPASPLLCQGNGALHLTFSEPVIDATSIDNLPVHLRPASMTLTGPLGPVAFSLVEVPPTGGLMEMMCFDLTPTVLPLAEGAHTLDFVNTCDTSGESLTGGSLSITVDRTGPTIQGCVISADNSTLTVTFSEGAYANPDATGGLQDSDFLITPTNGNATISSVTLTVHAAGGSQATFAIIITGTPDGSETITVKPSGGAAIYDKAGNPAASTTSCAKPLHSQIKRKAYLVLDFSSTMNSTEVVHTTGGDIQDTRVGFLKNAVAGIISVWQNPANVPDHAQDQIGIVLFSSDSTERLPLTAVTGVSPNVVDADAASGCTAMGSGLVRALRGLDYANTMSDWKRAIFLISDGMQNVNPMIYFSDNAAPDPIVFIDKITPDRFPPGGFICGSADAAFPGTAAEKPYVVRGASGGRTSHVPVHTIGIGDSGDFESLLVKISGTQYVPGAPLGTGGLHFQEEDLWPNVGDALANILVDLFKGASLQIIASGMANLPPSAAGSSVSRVIQTVRLPATAVNIIFSLSWPRAADIAITVRKDGQQVSGMSIQRTARYLVAGMRFGGAVASDKTGGSRPRPEGQWSIEAVRNDATAGDLPVSCTAFSDDRALDYDVSLPPCVVASPNGVTFELQVTDRGKPAGAVREAHITLLRPVESPENVLNRFLGRAEPKGSSVDVSGIGRAVETLRADPKAFAALRKRSSSTITLKRDPKKEGSFLATLPACTVAGSYHLEISFRVAIGPAAIETTRTVRRTLRVIPDARVITPEFHAEYDELEKIGYIMAVLKDKWGNIFGPGLGELIKCEPSWGAEVVKHDFLNCTYGIAVTGTSAKQWTSGTVRIEFGRQQIYSGIAGKMPKIPRRSTDLMRPFMERIEKSKS